MAKRKREPQPVQVLYFWTDAQQERFVRSVENFIVGVRRLTRLVNKLEGIVEEPIRPQDLSTLEGSAEIGPDVGT